jgi:hypothetical protein
MRLFFILIIFILNFQSWIIADDASEFEIEGMSLRSSLLDHLSKKEINKIDKVFTYRNKDVYQIVITNDILKLDTYDFLQLDLKTNDSDYKIPLIAGVIEYEKKIEQCKLKKEQIVQDIMSEFPTLERNDTDKPHPFDKTNDSIVYQSYFFLNSGDIIGIECEDWSKGLEKKFNYTDRLKVTLVSSEHNYWLVNKAHN